MRAPIRSGRPADLNKRMHSNVRKQPKLSGPDCVGFAACVKSCANELITNSFVNKKRRDRIEDKGDNQPACEGDFCHTGFSRTSSCI